MTDRYYGVGDNALTTLSVAINNVVTSVTVANGAVFTGIELPFVVTIADDITDANMEKMIVTAVAGNVLTVTRAFESTAVSHGGSSTVSARVLAKHVRDLMENAIFQINSASYVENTLNGTLQNTQSVVWETSAKLVKLAQVTYTYPDTFTKLPSSAVRVIYKGDGVTVRRTETTTFTWLNGILANSSRVLS